MVSTWATGNYTWNDIYLADFSVRFDGSSDFGSKQRWAPFFSGGLGVNIHNYEFLKGNEIVNKLKVRASYGRTGKASFPSYAATTMYEALFDEWKTSRDYPLAVTCFFSPAMQEQKRLISLM